jgi:hypothetical protein
MAAQPRGGNQLDKDIQIDRLEAELAETRREIVGLKVCMHTIVYCMCVCMCVFAYTRRSCLVENTHVLIHKYRHIYARTHVYTGCGKPLPMCNRAITHILLLFVSMHCLYPLYPCMQYMRRLQQIGDKWSKVRSSAYAYSCMPV